MAAEGTRVRVYGGPVKRYVQTMELRDDPELIALYRKAHSREEAWREILDGIKRTRLVMIVETPLDFRWDEAMARLATLPRQQEWEAHVARFQQCAEGATSDEKWQMMERMFCLYDE